MHLASQIHEETRPAYCEPVMLTIDGQRYWRTAETGCLKPVLTKIIFTESTSPAWRWLYDRRSLDYRLASYPQPGMVPAEPRQWVFEVTDRGLARFLAHHGAMQVAA